MARRRGRPPKPTAVDDRLLAAVHKALLQVARDVQLPTARYPGPASHEPRRERSEPRALDLAVLAVAGEQIHTAREWHDLTWEQIGQALGTSAQSAHVRFGKARPRATGLDGDTAVD
jgi:hypothetical protein